MNRAAAIGLGAANLFVTLVLAFDVIAAIVGLIGFLLIQEWLVVVIGLLMMYFMPKIYGFVVLPHLGLGALVVVAFEKGRTIVGSALGIISSLYNNVAIAGWMFLAFRMFLENQVAVVPFCWAYAVATVPFWTLALEERRSGPNAATNIIMFMIQMTALALGVARYAGVGPSGMLSISLVFIGAATAVNGVLMFVGRAGTKIVGPSKKCAECGTVRSIDYFNLETSSPDGHGPRCVACLNPDMWATLQKIKAITANEPAPLTLLFPQSHRSSWSL